MLNTRTTRRPSIQVILRAVALLDVLATGGRPMSLAEVRTNAGLKKSTAYNILGTLVEAGCVSMLPDTSQYKLGPTLLRLGAAYQTSHDVRAFAWPHMMRLRDVTGETVSLHIRIGWLRTCIDQVPSRESLRRVVRMGHQLDLYFGAIGLVLLGDLSDDDIRAYLAQANLVRITPTTVTDPDRILARVIRARELGYAMVVSESDASVGAVAVPIRRYDGRVDSGLAVSGPSNRWNEEAMVTALPEILACAGRISSEMGWGGVGLPMEPGGGHSSSHEPAPGVRS